MSSIVPVRMALHATPAAQKIHAWQIFTTTTRYVFLSQTLIMTCIMLMHQQLCSDCFVQMLHQRLSSPYLPDTDHSDYLVGELQDIQDVCTTSLPPLTTRAAPSYSPVPTSTSAPSASNGAFTNGTMSNSSTCDGQMLPSSHLTRRHKAYPQKFQRAHSPSYARDIRGVPVGARDFHHHVARSGSSNSSWSTPTNISNTCDQLSIAYGVTTGDLLDVSAAGDCSDVYNQCVPAKCTLKQVPASTSCDAMAELITTANFNVTTYQFLMWNPNVLGLCDELEAKQYVCVE